MTEIRNAIPSEEPQAQPETGIPQQRIMELLQEASALARIKEPQAFQRVAQIQVELMEAADLENTDQTINSRKRVKQNQGIRMFVDDLFFEAVENSPESIPTLFPVFAMISGSRPGGDFAKVDWSIAKPPSPQQAISEVRHMLGPNPIPSTAPQPPSGPMPQGGR